MEALEKLILIAVGLLILASFLYWAMPYLFKLNEYKDNIAQNDNETSRSGKIQLEKELFSNSIDLINKNTEQIEFSCVIFPILLSKYYDLKILIYSASDFCL